MSGKSQKTPKKPSKSSKAKKSLDNLKPFKPGVSGNPLGRPAVPEDILKARKLTTQEVERTIHAMLQMTEEQLEGALMKPESKTLDLLLGSILLKAMKGDHFRAAFILDRAGARLPANPIQINIAKDIESLPNTELAQLGKQAILILEASHTSIPREVKNE